MTPGRVFDLGLWKEMGEIPDGVELALEKRVGRKGGALVDGTHL